MEKINSQENNIIENFFKIWITKEIIHKSYFEYYYKTFLNDDGFFDTNKYKETLESIFNLISNNDATTVRPNNSEILDISSIENIIANF